MKQISSAITSMPQAARPPMREANYGATKLKHMALHWLRGRYPRALLTTELALGEWGSASVDVAAIDIGQNPADCRSQIIGVEVKGDGDTAARLERQGHAYARVATRMWLLPAPSVQKKCLRAMPDGWHWLGVTDDGELAPFSGRTDQAALEPPQLPNSAPAMADLLWSREVWPAMRQMPSLPPTSVDRTRDAKTIIGEEMPLKHVREVVCRTLYNRDWRGSFGIPKLVWYPDDPLPLVSA